MSSHIITMREVKPTSNPSARIQVRTLWGGPEKGKVVEIAIKESKKAVNVYRTNIVSNWRSIQLTPLQAFHLSKVLEQLHEPPEIGEVEEHE